MKTRTSIPRRTPVVAALLAFAVAASLSTSGPAWADEPGPDEVTLKNGGHIRGTVVSSEPGTSVKIIEVGKTEPRVIPWSQVSDVEKGKYGAEKGAVQPGPAGPGYAGPPAASGDQQGPPEPKLGDPGVVRLHIETPRKATIIENRSALIGSYRGYGIVLTAERTLCTSPCDTVVDAGKGSVFRLADDDYPSGGTFTLGSYSGDVTMTVEPGNTPKHTGGAWGIALGSLLLPTGAVLLALGQTATVTDENTGVTRSIPRLGVRNAGIGLLAGGAAVLGVGIALFKLGATNYTITQGAPPAAAKTAKVRPRYWLGEF